MTDSRRISVSATRAAPGASSCRPVALRQRKRLACTGAEEGVCWGLQHHRGGKANAAESTAPHFGFGKSMYHGYELVVVRLCCWLCYDEENSTESQSVQAAGLVPREGLPRTEQTVELVLVQIDLSVQGGRCGGLRFPASRPVRICWFCSLSCTAFDGVEISDDNRASCLSSLVPEEARPLRKGSRSTSAPT